MKSKMNQQVQPPEVLFLCNQRAEEELVTFQLAVASYLDHASKEAGLSFHQHLREFLAAIGDGCDDSSRR
jgi:hypothetical protein